MTVSDDEIKNLGFARKWHRYYRIGEVDSYLFRLANQIEEKRMEISALRTQNETLHRETSELTEKAVWQEQIIAEQIHEIGELGDQLSQSRIENVQQSERIAQQAIDIKWLQMRIGKLDKQVVILERHNSDDIIEEAVNKAEKIVNKAVEDRDKMLLQIDEQRGRLIAACRAAYCNALQFKQDLAEHFRNMEQELDASIDVLQVLDNSRLALNHNMNHTGTELNNTPMP